MPNFEKMLTYIFLIACLFHVGVASVINTRATQCFGNLGCFSSQGAYPVPNSPDHIATVFNLFSRSLTHGTKMQSVNYPSQISSWVSHFDSAKETKILIHGFLDSGSTPWMPSMVAALLKKGDFNVIIVDWGHGSKTGYPQAVSNTFLVGAEVAMLVKYLHDSHHVDYADVHLIGHSLGAQISGHVGHSIQALGRITGLDPADPGFTGQTTDRRLDASDASFVDVIHTDGSKFDIISGYGTHDPVGDIDFYPNGGQDQPGCEEHILASAIGHLTSAANTITCSHSRSRELFLESITSTCKFYGHTCATADGFEAGDCLGCPAGGCPMMGYDADQTKQTGTFYLSTSGKSPFCGHEYFVDVRVSNWMLHTYGEFMVTLVGSKGQSEPLKFESEMHNYDHGRDERHVIATHSDIGTVTSVKLQFLKAHDAHGLLSSNYIKIHSIMVEPAETATKTTFCAHEQRIYTSQTVSVTSHSGC